MDKVTIRHPEAGEAKVLPQSVPHWRASGWELVEEPAPEKAPAEKPAKKEESPRGRRATNGDED